MLSEGPGVHQMSTVIKFYFTGGASGVAAEDLRVFDFYKFNASPYCQSGGMELSAAARCILTPRPFIIYADNPPTALYYQL